MEPAPVAVMPLDKTRAPEPLERRLAFAVVDDLRGDFSCALIKDGAWRRAGAQIQGAAVAVVKGAETVDDGGARTRVKTADHGAGSAGNHQLAGPALL